MVVVSVVGLVFFFLEFLICCVLVIFFVKEVISFCVMLSVWFLDEGFSELVICYKIICCVVRLWIGFFCFVDLGYN